ncbi:protein kinase [Pyxidicoccus fallax]|uniref:Protein kinase n=1 Tax=Pyxidicoccus fallax TaxID=394095 RepID=A0A848LZK2_9BACT|nr:protein kinase [Pyxidicoccus fallax]NMO23286.1 protein kinase [Pyxidicoccus fallax]NPC86323.1 protein kinase [Pyxidicoccus fallax]
MPSSDEPSGARRDEPTPPPTDAPSEFTAAPAPQTLGAYLREFGRLSPREVVELAEPLSTFLARVGVPADSALSADRVVLENGVARLSASLAPGVDAAPVEPREQVRQLGVLLYEAASGSAPGAPPAPLRGSAAVLNAVLLRCLDAEPEARYVDLAEARKALDDALRSDGAGPTWFRTPPPPNASTVPTPVSAPSPSLLAASGATPVANLGEVLGNYRLERVLGEGAMGVVFVARHVRLDKLVAVKILKPQHGTDSSLVQRFFQEARAVNAINHENIVEIFDFVEEPAPTGAIPRFYCVLELLGGASLRQLLQQGEPLSVRRVARIGEQLCAALGAAHRAGIVHRDIKPDNIFLTTRAGETDFVKVLDFGVAKLTSTRLPQNPETFAGAVIGTPGYMSPEQASGLEVDGRADLYAVGTVLYELLSGRRPIEATELGQWAVDLLVRPPPPLPEKTPGGEPIPAALSAAVMRCLEKDPAHRFPSMEALADVLRPFAREPIPLVVAVPAEAAPVSPSPAPSRRHWPLAAVAGVALLAIPGALVWSSAKPAPEPTVAPAAVVAPTPAIVPVAVPPPPPAKVVLSIRSTPAGAKVFHRDSGEALGVTPLELTLSEPQPLRFELRGHQPAEATVRPEPGADVEVALTPAKPVREGGRSPSAPKRGARLTSPDGTLDPFRK